MKAKKKNKKIKLNEGRVLAFLLAIVILFLVLVGRLLYIGIFRSKAVSYTHLDVYKRQP